MLRKVKAMLKYTVESKTPVTHKQLKDAKAADSIWKPLDNIQWHIILWYLLHNCCFSQNFGVATIISIIILFRLLSITMTNKMTLLGLRLLAR